MADGNAYLSGKRILPPGLTGGETVETLVDDVFLAYNAARLREAAQLFVKKMLEPDVTVGLSVAGALTPAGLGASCIIPLIKSGFVDWIVSTGANLYHDLHFAFDKPLHAGRPWADDADLRRSGVVRIYDVMLDFKDCLVATDREMRKILERPELRRELGTAELHHALGKAAAESEERRKLGEVSVLAAAYRAGVPVYTSSPGDSGIGMDLAILALRGTEIKVNPNTDVLETAGIVFEAKRSGGKAAAFLLGGGSPKNFILQTEPFIQDMIGVPEQGQDYFLQITDARPDTGGLSGATPSEAVSWGKIDPNTLPDAVVCYLDTTVALPLITHYALANHEPRPPRRLYERRGELVELIRGVHLKALEEGKAW